MANYIFFMERPFDWKHESSSEETEKEEAKTRLAASLGGTQKLAGMLAQKAAG